MRSLQFLAVPALLLALMVPAGVQAQSSTACAALSYNLYFGLTDSQTGGEVSQLQSRLGGQVTGYFGPMTERLVQAWQASQGIVSSGSADTTGYGAVGPRTRALLATACGATTPVGVSPLSPNPSTAEPSGGTASSLPSCKIGYTRPSETLTVGDRVRINWTSTNATKAKWVRDISGKDSQTPPPGTPALSGSAHITLDVIGIAEVELEVIGPGGTSYCSLTLTVEEENEAEGTATIDASSLKAVPSGPTTITGRAENVTKVYVYQVSSGYVGGLDYESIVEANRGDGAPGQTAIIAYPYPSEVRNGKWSAYFGGHPSVGTYTVLVFDAVSKERLATGKLVVASVDTTGSVTFSKSTHDVARPTLTGTAKNLASFTIVLTGIGEKYGDVVFVKNGKWSHKVLSDLPNGTYGAEAYDPKGSLLGSGVFKVDVKQKSDAVSLEITMDGDPRTAYAWMTHHGTTETCGDLDIGTVNWGDGSTETVIAERMYYQCSKDATGDLAHQYASPGTYTVKFVGHGNVSVSKKITVEGSVTAYKGVMAVGVYEGSYPSGVSHSFGNHPEGTVNVNVTGDSGDGNRDLVLTSYEPVNWVLNVQGGAKIGKIIVSGYHKSRVTNVPAGTEVEYHSYETNGKYYYAYQASGDSYTSMKSWLTKLYPGLNGELNGNFQFPGYSASSIDVYIGWKG